ncbi:MAG: hypothetical protein K9I68_08875 [Bacteroidales bacterium]|nr:hypothetical protein [Bacteroidales bacterium]MCF8338315.1 hypothetical protein [Bacteroidales bacterium]
MTINKTLVLMVVLSFIIGLSSCMKDETDTQPEPEPDGTVDSIEQMNVPGDFDWKTSGSILLKVKGLHNGTVKVKNHNGKVYHKEFHNMFTHVSTMITLPDKINEVVIEYQGKTATVPIVDNKIIHSFIE